MYEKQNIHKRNITKNMEKLDNLIGRGTIRNNYRQLSTTTVHAKYGRRVATYEETNWTAVENCVRRHTDSSLGHRWAIKGLIYYIYRILAFTFTIHFAIYKEERKGRDIGTLPTF